MKKKKSIIFIGRDNNPEGVRELAAELAERLNIKLGIEKIHADDHNNIALDQNNRLSLQAASGNSTAGAYLEVLFFYGEDEISYHSFDYDSYTVFIDEIVDAVYKYINQTIKFVKYSERKRCMGQKTYRSLHDDQWELIDEWELSNKFIAFFIKQTKSNEKVFKFEL